MLVTTPQRSLTTLKAQGFVDARVSARYCTQVLERKMTFLKLAAIWAGGARFAKVAGRLDIRRRRSGGED
jgi:hypothetical protein